MQGNTIEQEINGLGVEDIVQEEIQEQSPSFNMPNLEFLKAKTGEGSIEQYIDHPLNMSKSQGLARVIRGFTGLLGALDLAIIDIIVGILEFSKERKKVTEVAN